MRKQNLKGTTYDDKIMMTELSRMSLEYATYDATRKEGIAHKRIGHSSSTQQFPLPLGRLERCQKLHTSS